MTDVTDGAEYEARLVSACAAIETRLEEKHQEYENYRGYLEMRVREQDIHGCWDAAVNMAEVSNYIDGLEFALEKLGGMP